jgi:hypothetical protein
VIDAFLHEFRDIKAAMPSQSKALALHRSKKDDIPSGRQPYPLSL